LCYHILEKEPRITRIPLHQEEKMSSETKTDPIATIESPLDFENLVLKADVPVLVDLWAPWCGPCRMQTPILHDLAGRIGDRARIVKLNVDTVPEIAMRLGVQAIPTLLVFRNGKEEKRFVGVQSAPALAGALGV